MIKDPNHSPTTSKLEYKSNSNCPIDISKIDFVAVHISLNSGNSTSETTETNIKIMNISPYSTKNFPKSLSILKKILTRGPKNQCPHKTSKNQSQFVAINIVCM